jgi:ATP-dependent exoDNAse (exonuclease V) alpha subunit
MFRGKRAVSISLKFYFNLKNLDSKIFSYISYVAIPTKTVSIIDSNGTLERRIQPLRVAFALTIHKSQSLTLPKARIDLGAKERPFSLTYVALSRVRRLEDLLLAHYGAIRFERIKMPDDIRQYINRTNELVTQTKQRFNFD